VWCGPQGIILVEMGHSAMSNGSACGNISEGMGVWWNRSDQLSRWGLWVNTGSNPYHLSLLCHFSILSTKKPPPWTQAEVNISWTWTEASQPKKYPNPLQVSTNISKSLHIGRWFCLAYPNSVRVLFTVIVFWKHKTEYLPSSIWFPSKSFFFPWNVWTSGKR